jgi:type II secretory ATPase GspE/PulE/Tfp pilus assembly ATPase PilB-like protein/GGDEF domain-containing protein
LATADPFDFECENRVWFVLGAAPIWEIAPPGALKTQVHATYPRQSADAIERMICDLAVLRGAQPLSGIEVEVRDVYDLDEASSSAVVSLVNTIFRAAILERASDVHIEPEQDHGVVRFRIDGTLRHRLDLPHVVYQSVVARIKLMGGMDIADHLHPHDGRTRVTLNRHEYDLRLSSVPTRGTQKVVARILDPHSTPSIDELGFDEYTCERYRQLLGYRDGIVVVTGPTGSGKTTTLYAALRELTTGSENIMSIEDPIEYQLPGITQVQVETRQSVTFSIALRHLLRQDPDVIFVGEIRDSETAQMAAQASMTGHLLLTTLHTNDAISTIPRLLDLGLTPHLIAANLRGVVAQRLVRRACPHCRKVQPADDPTDHRIAAQLGILEWTSIGCRRCERTGYRGRVPIAEVLQRTPAFQHAIESGAGPQELQRVAVENGMRPLVEAALLLVREGITTLSEVRRILGEQVADIARQTAQERSALAQPESKPTTTTVQAMATPNTTPVADHRTQQATLRARYDAWANTPRVLALFDITGLREINARHGESTGDALIAQIQQALATGGSDVCVSHWQGGEFLLLMRDIPGARELLETLLHRAAASQVEAQGAIVRPKLAAGATRVAPHQAFDTALAAVDRLVQSSRGAVKPVLAHGSGAQLQLESPLQLDRPRS